jgi:hypothetical protein
MFSLKNVFVEIGWDQRSMTRIGDKENFFSRPAYEAEKLLHSCIVFSNKLLRLRRFSGSTKPSRF